MKLSTEYYQNPDPVFIAKDLLGKTIHSTIGGLYTSSKIVETEAYNGRTDKACHAHLQRKTKRTSIMYESGGVAYVYLIYGFYYLFNIVTNQKGFADAVLIRGAEPIEGIDFMRKRRPKAKKDKDLTNGPGKLCLAHGIDKTQYGEDLTGGLLWIEDSGVTVPKQQILARPRVNIDYAEEDKYLPWRFSIADNPFVSPAKT